MASRLAQKVTRQKIIGRDALVRRIRRDQMACGLVRDRIASAPARSDRKASAAADLLAELDWLDRLLAVWAAAARTGPASELDAVAAQWAQGRRVLVAIVGSIPLAVFPSKLFLAPRRRSDVIVTDR